MKFKKKPSAKKTNMAIYFTLTWWCCYIGQMHGRPRPESDSCQKLLYFLLMNPQLVVRGWRNMQQLFSSASFFEEVKGDLQAWIHEGEVGLDASDNTAIKAHQKQVAKRKRKLRKLIYDEKMYDMLGSAIMGFISKKAGTFPKALMSQRHFKLVPTWKRANICVRLLSHVLDFHCNHHWYNFKYESYKFMTQVFEAYCSADEEIWSVCHEYVSLPKDVVTRTPPRKKRTRKMFELPTPPKSNDQEAVICLITSSSESDEEDSEQDAATPPPKQRSKST